MALCPKCGAQTQGRYCARCGAPVADGGSAPAQVEMTDNVVSTLCYLLLAVGGLLFLVLEPYNRKRQIRFHAFQSIFFTVALAVAWIAVIFVGVILAYIPFIGGIAAGLLFLLVFGAAFLLWILLMYKAYNNQPFVLPVIGPLAEKQA